MKAFPHPKDPADDAWYQVDVSGVVGDDPASTITCAVPTGLTKISEARDGNVYKIKLGDGEAGQSYLLPLVIWTAGGQVFERTVKLKVKEL